MSTVVDLGPLVALEAQVSAEPTTEPVQQVETPSVPDTLKPEPEEAKTESKEAEKKPEPAALEVKKPEVIAKGINEKLQRFFSEAKPTAEGKELLRSVNKEVGELYKQVAEAKGASADVQAVTSAARELQELVQASDELVYSGDPQIVSNIYNDVVATNGNAEAFDKLVPAFVDKLKETNPRAYYEQHVAPIYQHALESTGMVEAVRGLIKSYNAGDQAALRTGIEEIAKHISDVGRKTEQHKVDAEKAKATRVDAETRSNLESEMVLNTKKALGKELGVVLRTTELGTYPRETLVELSRHILNEAERRIDTDAAFNRKLEQLYKDKGAEAVRAENLKKIQSIAKDVVDFVVKQVYPNLGKRSAKSEAPTATYIDTAEGKALVVKTKPSNLDRTAKRADVMEIAGRGYTTVNGKRTLVSWRRN